MPAPGATKRIPCSGNAKLTYDLYLPRSYSPKAVPGHPAVFLSSPNKNPGFRGLEKWAEANGVVLVTINDSQNGPDRPNEIAQDAVLESVKSLRLHPGLKFATGLSGAASDSALLVRRHPKDFAGAVLQCHSLFRPESAKHLSVVFITGKKDTVHSPLYVHAAALLAGNSGRYVREIITEGGHTWADPDLVAKSLSRMLWIGRLSHPACDGKERAAALAAAEATVKSADAGSVSAESLADWDALLFLKELKGKAFRSKALELWCAGTLTTWSALPARDALAEVNRPSVRERYAECTGSRSAFDSFRKRLTADVSLKAEVAAWKAFEPLRVAFNKVTAPAHQPGGKDKISYDDYKGLERKLQEFIKKNPGTLASDEASSMLKVGSIIY